MKKDEYRWEIFAGNDKNYLVKMPYKYRIFLTFLLFWLLAILIFMIIMIGNLK